MACIKSKNPRVSGRLIGEAELTTCKDLMDRNALKGPVQDVHSSTIKIDNKTFKHSHRIHGTGTFTYIYHENQLQ